MRAQLKKLSQGEVVEGAHGESEGEGHPLGAQLLAEVHALSGQGKVFSSFHFVCHFLDYSEQFRVSSFYF